MSDSSALTATVAEDDPLLADRDLRVCRCRRLGRRAFSTARGKSVYSFYLFEGSCDVGAGVGEWEYVEVRGEQDAIRSAVFDYLRGGWDPTSADSDVLVVRVFQHGRLVWERDLYPFLTVKLPGRMPMRFDGGLTGGEPEPGSGLPEDADEEDFWEELAVDYADTASSSPDEIEITIDWEGVGLPALADPVLPEGATAVDEDEERRFTYGGNDYVAEPWPLGRP